MLESREVVSVDIAYDELPEKHYVPEEVRHVLDSNFIYLPTFLLILFYLPLLCNYKIILQQVTRINKGNYTD